MRTRISVTAALTAVALLVLTGAPANAEYYAIDDPADASASLTDVYGLEAMHGTDNVLVKVRFNELMRSSAAGISVFIDTDRDVRGPEYVLSSGLGDGTDYVLTEAVAWRGSDDRVDCDYEARPRWGKDVFRARISRECLDDPASVRVSVKMVDQADGSHPVVDWVPRRHRWSLPIASGLAA
jgi:fructose-specific component phosphotransferase system IIB-like protein